MDTCPLDGCDRPYYARGLCERHYRRLMRRGSPTVVLKAGRPRSKTLEYRPEAI